MLPAWGTADCFKKPRGEKGTESGRVKGANVDGRPPRVQQGHPDHPEGCTRGAAGCWGRRRHGLVAAPVGRQYG